MFDASCTKCHVQIGRFHDDRVQRGVDVYHRKCLREVEQEEQQLEQQKQLQCHIGKQLRIAA